MKEFVPAVGLAGLAMLAGCGSDIAEGPVSYPVENGTYFQVFEAGGRDMIEIARVRNGSVSAARGELPAGQVYRWQRAICMLFLKAAAAISWPVRTPAQIQRA